MKAMHLGAALGAVLFAACAHGGTNRGATESYLGGRAGQPYSFVAQDSGSHEVVTPPSRLAYHGGQAAQPYSWLNSGDAEAPPPAYCYQGGRDAQPASGPALRFTRVQNTSGERAVCEMRGASRL